MSSRRSTRQAAARHRYDESEGQHIDHMHTSQSYDMNLMMGMGMGTRQMSHHMPVDGYYNMGYHHFPQQFPQYHPHPYHHPGDISQVSNDDDVVPSSGRSLRTRGGSGRGGRNVGNSASTSASTSNMIPPTPGGNLLVESAGDDSDDDDGEGDGKKSKKGSGMETVLTVDQMVQNCLYYMLLAQHKKIPVKKSDIIKNAMNCQSESFREVLEKLESILDKVFGMKLIKLDKGNDHLNVVSQTPVEMAIGGEIDVKGKRAKGAATSYIVTSKFPTSVCDSVMMRNPELDGKRTVLYLVLSTIFMLNQPIDENEIWQIIEGMELGQIVCEKRDYLRKFLKSEFVSAGYLNIQLSQQVGVPQVSKRRKDDDTDLRHDSDQIGAKYTWGPRAHMEFDKGYMLKFITNFFPGKHPYEFTVQYNMVRNQKNPLIDKDVLEERYSDNENDPNTDGDNGSALQIRQRSGGRGEAYAIDTGENTETETEGAD